MKMERFAEIVSRLERESIASPRTYRAKVAGLALLGYGIMALLVAGAVFGLLLLAGLTIVVALSGGTALILLFKVGKVLLLLAIPLWFFIRSSIRTLFIRFPAPTGREITREQAPELFAAMDLMRTRMRGPRFHHVLVVDDLNAAIVQRSSYGFFGWPRNYLILGLPLLEALPPEEALALVAHEYGHLTGAHGRFSAFIYRLRHTWAHVEAHIDELRGWLSWSVAPLMRWYAPYFNAYTFVLARANEYHADAVSVDLVGYLNAAHALKRTSLICRAHQEFMQAVCGEVAYSSKPPHDLLVRWGECALRAASLPNAKKWLSDALDHKSDALDTHPTLRLRLLALPGAKEKIKSLQDLPPHTSDNSAAVTWLEKILTRLRSELQGEWTASVSEGWSERHAEITAHRERLRALRASDSLDQNEELECIHLTRFLEPEVDLRPAAARYNAAHPNHPVALYLEANERLKYGEREGLELLTRVIELDPEATKAALQRAVEFFVESNDDDSVRQYLDRWVTRDIFEKQRASEYHNIDPRHVLVAHQMDDETLAAVRAQLTPEALLHVERLYLARRVLPSDPSAVTYLIGLELTWWGWWKDKGPSVMDRLGRADLPIDAHLCLLHGKFRGFSKQFKALRDAQLVGSCCAPV